MKKKLKLTQDLPGYKKDTVYVWDAEQECYLAEGKVPVGSESLPTNWPKDFPNWFEASEEES